MRVRIYILALLISLASCGVYKQDVMFRAKDGSLPVLTAEVARLEQNYTIQPNDILQIEVYTNNGERLVDPDFQLLKELGVGQNALQRQTTDFLVQSDGVVRLPMVGTVELAGLTLQQADILLQRAYAEFYKEPYVLTRYVNKRVIVLGAVGGQVVPVANEQTSLLEVLALAGGLAGTGRAYNIRLIRGDLTQPTVYQIDLSTVEGMQQASLQVQPGDVVYVEPIRRVLLETVRDIGPIVGVISNVITLVVVIISLQN